MAHTFDKDDKIGDIVTQFPGASDLFYQYHIDFCCGGGRPLDTALKEQNLDADQLLQALNEKYQTFCEKNSTYTDWAKEKPSLLIDHIVSTHHAFLRERLPQLSEYVFKIMKVHGAHHEELYDVHKLFNALRTELEAHLVKEEEQVFPLIKKYEADGQQTDREKVLRLIQELENEHTGAGDIIKELREVTDHYTVPQDACRTYERTFALLQELESDIFQHIHLENNILFQNI